MTAADPRYGTDWSCLTGLDPTGSLVSGSQLMAQVAFRRLYCPLKGLWSDPDQVTLDVRDFLGAPIDPRRDLPRIRQQCEAAMEGDERIFSATCLATWDQGTGTLRLDCSGVGAAGPFKLLLDVTAVTVSILRNS